MPLRAYVFIDVAVGTIRQVTNELSEIPQVAQANQVTGPYDIIAVRARTCRQSRTRLPARFIESTESQER